jgi:hypothetical protein
MSETITVADNAPVINRSTNTLGTDLSADVIETLPTGRNYSSVVQITPGVSSDAVKSDDKQAATISVYGSSGVLLGQRYSFQESDNGLAKSANTDYLKPIVRTPALSARLGVRWTF